MKTPSFYAEITDTFGGEANYCWVHRYLINAKSFRGAVTKLTRASGYNMRKVEDHGDMRRYNVPNACICAFVSWADENAAEQYPNAVTI